MKVVEVVSACINTLIEYRPPTKENVKFLIDGGFVSLKVLRDYFVKNFEPEEGQELSAE